MKEGDADAEKADDVDRPLSQGNRGALADQGDRRAGRYEQNGHVRVDQEEMRDQRRQQQLRASAAEVCGAL